MPRTKLTGQEAIALVEKQREYRASFDREHYKTITIKFRLDRDAEILAKLESVPNKTEYLIRLIQADIAANGSK